MKQISPHIDDSPKDIAHSVQNFVLDALNPILAKNSDTSFEQAWQACAAFGLLGVHIESAWGGAGRSIVDSVEAIRALGEHCIDSGFSFAINVTNFTHASTLSMCASDAQKELYLAPLCRGEIKLAYAITEENSGSDAFSLACSAEFSGNNYRLNGQKCYASLCPIADAAIVFASTNPERKQWGITAFLVPMDTPEVTTSTISKQGLQSTPMGSIDLTDCVLPKSAVMGKVGAGSAIFDESQLWERSFILTSQVGAMRRQLSQAVIYVNQREQSGQSIGKFQSVSNRLADMQVRLTTSELLLQHTARIRDSGGQGRIESASTKLHISESVVNNSMDALRIWGAKGYTGEAQATRDVQDSLAGLLLAGTSDIQRNIISRLLGVR